MKSFVKKKTEWSHSHSMGQEQKSISLSWHAQALQMPDAFCRKETLSKERTKSFLIFHQSIKSSIISSSLQIPDVVANAKINRTRLEVGSFMRRYRCRQFCLVSRSLGWQHGRWWRVRPICWQQRLGWWDPQGRSGKRRDQQRVGMLWFCQ